MGPSLRCSFILLPTLVRSACVRVCVLVCASVLIVILSGQEEKKSEKISIRHKDEQHCSH